MIASSKYLVILRVYLNNLHLFKILFIHVLSKVMFMSIQVKHSDPRLYWLMGHINQFLCYTFFIHKLCAKLRQNIEMLMPHVLKRFHV